MIEKVLDSGDIITIGETRLAFPAESIRAGSSSIHVSAPPISRPKRVAPSFPSATGHTQSATVAEAGPLNYDDKPLGHTQVQIRSTR